MVQTFSSNNKIYSVDMMLAYINIFKPNYIYINIDSLMKNLDYKAWGDPIQEIHYSPMDVLKTPKKYKDEIKRIKNADLRYPIIITSNNNIVDGVHRLTKAYLNKNKKIKVYKFMAKDMSKFLINNEKDFKKVDKLNLHDFIKLFYKRFCKQK
jgi:hypothetical protein